MEVKPGYKQTEVGVIPEEWRECDISDLCQLQRGFDLTEATRKRGDIPVYSSSGLSYFHNEARLQPPAVITGRKGMLGRVFFVEEPCWPHDTTLWVKDFKGNHPRFVALFLGQFRLERFDAATSVPTLNRNNVVGIPIKLPPLPEQRAIAEALSDVDGLLGGLDRLIAKKRDLKQAAMQQLLTGQTRLPGFHGDWEVVTAREIGVFRGGSGFPLEAQGESNGDYPFFKVSDMNNEGNETFMTSANHWISEHTRKSLGANAFPANAIVLAKVGAAIFLERKKILGQPSCIDNNMAAFVLDQSRADVRFVHTLLLSKKLGSLVATTALPALNGKQLGEMVLTLPPLPEQTAIASVLSEMDGELAVLEQRREKTRALKQAMMQELLTGRTRLV